MLKSTKPKPPPEKMEKVLNLAAALGLYFPITDVQREVTHGKIIKDKPR